MPDNYPKRNRSELEDADTNIVTMIKDLGSKMDAVKASVTENSNTMLVIDQKLTAKIDKMEQTMAASLKQIKEETDARFSEFTKDINDRFVGLSSDTQEACHTNDEFVKDLSDKMDVVQNLNETRLQKLERDLLRNELIITGVPIVVNENVSDIIGDICEATKCNITAGDVLSVYRIPTARNKSSKVNGRRDLSSPIILKMISDWGKNELMSAYFHKKNLNTKDIGFKSGSRIYINESLTKYNRSIFNAASEAKKSKSIFKCYTRNGLVHVQLKDGGKIIRVVDLDQLDTILGQAEPVSQTTISNNATSSATNQPTHASAASSPNNANLDTNKPPTTTTVHDGDMEQN